MANQLYDIARKKFAEGDINWTTDSIKMLLISETGNYSFDAGHTTALGTISASARNYGAGTDPTPAAYLEGIPMDGRLVSTNGACRCENITFETIGAENNDSRIKAVVIFRESDDTPIAYLDSATGLPITPNGGAIIVVPDGGTNGLFRL